MVDCALWRQEEDQREFWSFELCWFPFVVVVVRIACQVLWKFPFFQVQYEDLVLKCLCVRFSAAVTDSGTYSSKRCWVLLVTGTQ